MLTLKEIGNLKGFGNAITRWAKFGPYYAMFPIEFAFNIVEKYSRQGDYIIDPFAGRCSSIYASGVLGRNSLGIEINPLGWLYGKVKLKPAPEKKIVKRLKEIYEKRYDFKEEASQLSDFFKICYCKEVLYFLLSVRNNLNWTNNHTDRTLMSFISVHLHGKIGEGLSNQLRQTKAMGPNYSVNWWKNNNKITPPEINPFEFLRKKIEWRYARGIPSIDSKCRVILGDSTNKLVKITKESAGKNIKYSLLFTSPPYHAVTDYHSDQWLRLWLLGGRDKPATNTEKHKGRFNSKEKYLKLLKNVFLHCSEIMDTNSTVFVRTDARKFTYEATLKILRECFPHHNSFKEIKSVKKRTQTDLFNKNNFKYGEVDIILQP